MNQSGLDCPEVWARRAFSARASSLPAFTSFSNWRSHASASNATYHRRNAASSSEESFSICCSIASTLLIHHLHSPGPETASVSLLSISNKNARILALEKDAVQLPIRSPAPRFRPIGQEEWRPDGLLCSRNARPRKALVGRAQLRASLATSVGAEKNVRMEKRSTAGRAFCRASAVNWIHLYWVISR